MKRSVVCVMALFHLFRLGVTFLANKGDRMVIRIRNEDITYHVLHVLEFDATRKCMSVIVKNPKGVFH